MPNKTQTLAQVVATTLDRNQRTTGTQLGINRYDFTRPDARPSLANWRVILGNALIDVTGRDASRMSWQDKAYNKVYYAVWGSPGELEEHDLDPAKGLMLVGAVGCGKTQLVAALRKLRLLPCKAYSCQDVALDVSSEGAKAIKEYAKGWHDNHQKRPNRAYFDDLGLESECNHFGTKLDPMAEILLARYNHFEGSGLLTHCSTNLLPKDLKARYGDRVASRCRAMFNVIDGFEEFDFRKV